MRKSEQAYIPYKEIARKLGIDKGDCLLLTSDILKLAMKARKHEKEFDVNAFINSFIDALGPEGTLLIPAFNFDLEHNDHYDIARTEPMTGALAVAAMKRSDFRRTSNALHSFYVIGKDAEYLTGLDNISSFDTDSPFAYMLEKNTIMLFAGTSIAQAMTFTHFVEESLKVRYRRYKTLNIQYTNLDGDSQGRSFKIYAKKPGYTMVMEELQRKLSQAIVQELEINGVSFTSIRCETAFGYIKNDIQENNAASIVKFSTALYLRDILKQGLLKFNLFRTTYGKIRSGKRIS